MQSRLAPPRPGPAGTPAGTGSPAADGAAGRRLALLLAAVLLLIAGTFAIVTWQDRVDALEEGWEKAEQAASGAAEHASRGLAASRLLNDRVAEAILRDGPGVYRGDGQDALAAMLRHTPQVGSLWVMDAKGVLVANSLEPAPPGSNFANSPYFPPLRDGQASFLGTLVRGRLSRIWFFGYATAVRDHNGAFLGVVQAAMHAEEFERFRQGLGLGADGAIGLFRLPGGEAVMLAPVPQQRDTVPALPWAPAPDALAAAAAGQRSGRAIAATTAGMPALVAWQRLPGDDPLVAVAAMPRSAALAGFWERVQRNAVLFVLASTGVLGLGLAVAASVARGAASRREAEAGRRELAALLEAAGEGVVVLDRAWRITFANSRATTGLAAAPGLLARSFWDGFPELFGGPIWRACEIAMQSRAPASAETLHPRLGRRFAAQAHPREDGGLVVFFRDVTEERAGQAALRESEARLRRVLDGLFTFVGVLAPDGTLLEANRAPLEAAGIRIEDVRGKLFWDCHWWAHDAAIQAQVRAACTRAAAGQPARYDVEVRMAGESRMLIDFQVVPLRDADGRVTHLIPSAIDVTAQRAAEAALAESEARLRLAQEAADVGVFEHDLVTDRAHWTAAMFRLWGADPPERGPWLRDAEYLALLHPDDREMHRARRDAMRADPSQARFTFEFRIIRPDTGELRWLASRGEVVRDAAGRPLVVRGITLDVTERHRAEERQLLLAREVDHRAKNALAVVQSIVGLTRVADPAAFRAAVTGRIAAMARAHTLLAREGWDGAELRMLVEEELAPHSLPEAPDRIAIAGPAVTVSSSATQPLAMALHELATNAAKYGALSVAGGRVAIVWQAAAEGGLLLRWVESGGPAVAGTPEKLGFGSSVIRNTVTRQLGGTVAFGWPESGLVCEVALPARQVRWAG